MEKQKVILSGMRPTGDLHIGHYVGVLKNWKELQDQNFDCYFFVADWHALTSNYDSIDVIAKSRIEYVKAWLACGIDPQKVHIYNQSDIPAILNLSQVFLNLTQLGWADRSPSWKEAKQNNISKLDHVGFFTYPILQTADIAIVNADFVPVGEDQVTHLEIAREIIRKFNRTYNATIKEPAPKLTKTPRLMGLDGHKKMSSSLGNTISLKESEKSLQKKINKIRTDDTRPNIESPGNPDNCTVYDYHKTFSSSELVCNIAAACRNAKLGCGECKQLLGNSMKEELIPIAEKFEKISDQHCLEVLNQGTKKVQPIIENNWQEIRQKMRF